jgi:hypothetical protein
VREEELERFNKLFEYCVIKWPEKDEFGWCLAGDRIIIDEGSSIPLTVIGG